MFQKTAFFANKVKKIKQMKKNGTITSGSNSGFILPASSRFQSIDLNNWWSWTSVAPLLPSRWDGSFISNCHTAQSSDVIKDTASKVKAKDMVFKAMTKAKNFGPKAKYKNLEPRTRTKTRTLLFVLKVLLERKQVLEDTSLTDS